LRATYEHPRAVDYRQPGGPWDTPSLDELLTRAGRLARGDVLVDDSAGVRMSWTELDDLVARVAGGLRGAGVRRGDVVAWQAPNWYEVVVLYRACWRLGAVAAPAHHQAGPAEVDRMLAQVDPKVMLSRDEVRGRQARFPALAEAVPQVGGPAGAVDGGAGDLADHGDVLAAGQRPDGGGGAGGGAAHVDPLPGAAGHVGVGGRGRGADHHQGRTGGGESEQDRDQ